MAELSPVQAANLANAVYGIRETDKISSLAEGIAARMKGVANQLDTLWDVDGGKIIKATSGGLGSVQDSGFAMVLKGKNSMKGQTAVAIRGTVTKPDWISNANAIGTSGPNGLTVHNGFFKIYSTMRKDLLSALDGAEGQIHVSGHSLGGALSNLLCADLMSGDRTKPQLYTFGAPRVGTTPFALALESKLGKNIHRVYDVSDPVPMVPIFPYLHSPASNNGLRVGNSGGLIDAAKHDMRDNYTALVRGLQWGGVASAGAKIRNFRQVDELLDMAGIHVSIPGGSWGLWALGKALQAIIDVAFLIEGVVAAVSDFIVDKLAALIIRAAQLVKQLGSSVKYFMGLVFKWAGRKIGDATELTVQFLSYAIKVLLTPIAVAGRRALDKFTRPRA